MFTAQITVTRLSGAQLSALTDLSQAVSRLLLYKLLSAVRVVGHDHESTELSVTTRADCCASTAFWIVVT